MKTKILFLALIISVIACNFISCNKDSNDVSNLQAVVLDLPAKAYDYSIDTNFILNNKVVTLGRVLFYDAHLSVNNAISCASCHKQTLAFSDNSASSLGYQNVSTRRNAPPIQNIQSNNISLFWDGREKFPLMVLMPAISHVEMGMSDMNAIATKVANLPYYKQLFDDANMTISVSSITSALTEFVQSIFSNNSRFDKFLKGELTLTALEDQGRKLFFDKYNCNGCHQTTVLTGGYQQGGGNTTDPGFINIGLDVSYADNGQGEITKRIEDNGKFKIPNLHNVALTAPYMHDGRFKTLDDVLNHYSQGIQNHPNLDPRLLDSNKQPLRMNISSQEKSAIIAFLNTMTDYELISDPKFSNPFKVKQ